MNPTDKTPAIDTTLTITNVIDTGSAFAETEDGQCAFISSNIMRRAGALLGDVVSAKVVPNDREADRTPWRCIFVSPGDREVHIDRTQQVLSVLEGGGVWTPDDMAEETGVSERACRAIMESIFRSGLCTKFLRYTDPGRHVDLVAFTLFPETVRFVCEGEAA